MPIGYDPTECREGSSLPSSVCQSGIEIQGFEERTGGDLVVTLEKLIVQDVRSKIPPIDAVLQRYVDHGFLVQRKSGSDFVGSIGDLSDIQRRMRRWASPERCVLLITDLRFTRDGYAVSGGRATKWTFESIRGKLRWWAARGGWYEILPEDQDISQWLTDMYGILSRAQESPVIATAPEKPLQKMVDEPDNWVTTGNLFPRGVGRAKREALALELDPECDPVESPPSLGEVLLYTTSGRLRRAQGWGPTLLQRMRDYCGVEVGRVIRDTGGFSMISLVFKDPLPFVVSGEGIEVIPLPDGSTRYIFTEYSALENVALVLGAIGRKEHGE